MDVERADNSEREIPAENNEKSHKGNYDKMCGIIMPISGRYDYSKNHWSSVRSILEEAARLVKMTPRMVWKEETSGIVHHTIIDRLLNYPIIVCDVSGTNPNVMFELGMRLARNKPAIIVKDDSTPFEFDTSIIQHIIYPRDLNHHKIKMFMYELAVSIEETSKAHKEYETAINNNSTPQNRYTPFMDHFLIKIYGSIKNTKAKIKEKEMNYNEYILSRLDSIETLLRRFGERVAMHRIVLTKDMVFSKYDIIECILARIYNEAERLEISPKEVTTREYFDELMGDQTLLKMSRKPEILKQILKIVFRDIGGPEVQIE